MQSPNTGTDLSSYLYDLPEEKVAKFPLEKRDQAKLLVYRQGSIEHSVFAHLADFLPQDSLLVFNDTKVIPARLFFHKESGATIELFLLQPERPHLVAEAMQSKNKCIWKCLIGNKKRWKNGEVLFQRVDTSKQSLECAAMLLNEELQWVEFNWEDPQVNFAEVLQILGEVPLPPYLKRKPVDQDKQQYQTVYSANEGAVAAPTAGLHFTNEVFASLKTRGIKQDFVTLHVSGGTFQPIKNDNFTEHPMHSEQVIIKRSNLEHLRQHIGKTIAVGTTSMRTLESLYWFGVRLYKAGLERHIPFRVERLCPYSFQPEKLPDTATSLELVWEYMHRFEMNELIGETEIFIYPGYTFKICRGLVTNYHLPGSTLILLVAAFIGRDWKKVYQTALNENYRFLSYGDSSLLIP